MNICRIFIYLTAIAVCLFPALSCADQGQEATVMSSAVQVHSAMSEGSTVVGTLQEGAVVVVEFEIEKAGEGWCSIIRQGDSKAMGYVRCRFLEMKAPVKHYDRMGVQGSGYRDSGSKEDAAADAKRPYSDIQVVMYMTDW